MCEWRGINAQLIGDLSAKSIYCRCGKPQMDFHYILLMGLRPFTTFRISFLMLAACLNRFLVF